MPIRESLKGRLPGGSKDSGAGKSSGGGRPSVRRDIPGANRVANLVGHGKSPYASAESVQDHRSAPLSTLKDPDSFGPPPRHVARAEPTIPVTTTSSAKTYATTGTVAFPESKVLATAPKGGSWGAPLPQSSIQAQRQAVQEEEEEVEAPPVPYRANTTGLVTTGLPAPPVRRPEPQNDVVQQPAKPAARTAPKPPPRLPPRQNSNPTEYTEAPPPPYAAGPQQTAAATQSQQPGSGYLNTASLNRLGQAGVSVPGLDIGSNAAEQPLHQSGVTSPRPEQSSGPSSGQLSELQARFKGMPGRVSSPTVQSPQTTGSGSGTTWQQKQAALSTASRFQKDPSSVSLSDAREAGGTLNNFRQRHGEQVAQGLQQAQDLDKKHGVSTRLGGLSQGQQQQPTVEEAGIGSATPFMTAAASKKPAPPPPKKKSSLLNGAATGTEPPPIPMSSKPRQ